MMPTHLFEGVVNKIPQPGDGPVTVRMDISCILGDSTTAQQPQGKMFDISGVVAKLMVHTNVRRDLYENNNGLNVVSLIA